MDGIAAKFLDLKAKRTMEDAQDVEAKRRADEEAKRKAAERKENLPQGGEAGFNATQKAEMMEILQQVMGGEVRTQVVLWHNVCNSVHLVMKEMMTAVEVNMISSETFSKMCKQLYSKLCCLPVDSEMEGDGLPYFQ